MKTTVLLLKTLIALTLFLFACSKKDFSPERKARMQIALTDGPGNYEAVNIDVQEIRINYSNDTANGWTILPGVKAGVYDVSRLANGKILCWPTLRSVPAAFSKFACCWGRTTLW